MMKTFQKQNQSYLNKDQIFQLEQKAAERLEELLETLGIGNGLKKNGRAFCGCCPVHGGDKQSAFSLFHNGHTTIGNWRCYTNGCHNTFQPTILGLIRGVLSRQNGWSSTEDNDSDKVIRFGTAVKFLVSFVNEDISNFDVDEEELEKRRFNRSVGYINNDVDETSEVSLDISRDQVRCSLKIPAEYYMYRSPPFSSAILDKYDVGICDTPKKPMNMRAVVPIYNDEYTKVIGVTGRSIFDQCSMCKSYHNPRHQCPDKDLRFIFTKWRHNSGFKAERHLYNFWFARKFIEESRIAILTESTGNVWRLEECGIHNSLGTFGAHLTPDQRFKLDGSGALSLILLYDPDKAGAEATEYITRELGKLYNIIVPDFGRQDIADTPKEKILSILTPIINRLQGEYK